MCIVINKFIMAVNLFGYEISKRVSSEAFSKDVISPIPKSNEEGATTVTVGGGYYGQFNDWEINQECNQNIFYWKRK